VELAATLMLPNGPNSEHHQFGLRLADSWMSDAGARHAPAATVVLRIRLDE
jgi:hypothetical protein